MNNVIKLADSELYKLRKENEQLKKLLSESHSYLDYIANFYVYPQDLVDEAMWTQDENYFDVDEKKSLYYFIQDVKMCIQELI